MRRSRVQFPPRALLKACILDISDALPVETKMTLIVVLPVFNEAV